MRLSFSMIKTTYAFFWMCLMFSTAITFAQNPIVAENSLTGSPSSEWDVAGAGSLSIQGFATDFSINTGTTVNFKIDVKAPATNFTAKIYRLGYYNGNGARLIANLGSFPGIAQAQPLYEVATGKTDCGNWSVSASWNSAAAVSGVYFAKITRADNGGSSHILFVVRNDNGNADMLFKTSDATWQAYNGYGGNSLYLNNSGTSVPGYDHATKVSYNRPFLTRSGGGGSSSAEDWVFNAEYPMIRWLERNGYHVSYTTDVDMDRSPTQLTPSIHKILMSVGHDEYWSAAARSRFETARNNGVHLAFFSGNEVYWKTRWEDNHRTLVCFKEGTMGEHICGAKCDTSTNVWTGSWRDGNPAEYPGSDGGKPENALSGQISWTEASTSIEVPHTYKNLRFWRNTSVSTLNVGQTASFTDGTLGYEWDFEQFENFYPTGRITLSKTTVNGKTHKLSMYRHSSGALVFGAGTVQWSWGLDGEHDRGNDTPNQDVQQATVNLFADMGVQPVGLQSGLTLASASVDVSAPISVIVSPSHGDTIAVNNPVTIYGTASDTGGVAAGVEVSVDGGLTWKSAIGTTNWTYTFTPTTQGQITIKTRAVDDSYNIESSGSVPSANAIEIAVTLGTAPICPCTIWNPASIPTNITENDPTAIELGVKFRSNVDGYITGIRFYKGPSNTGVHIGNLWSISGTNLAQATFTSETASGWQQVTFANPVAVSAGTTYVASYHTNTGNYSQDVNIFNAAVQTYYLTALADGDDGMNGVYTYSSSTTFPTSGFQSSNYWVDVVFNTTIGADTTSPVVVSVSPPNNSSTASITVHPTITFNEPIDVLSANTSSVMMSGPGSIAVSGSVSCSSGTITFTPGSSLAYSTTYTVTVKGGTGTAKILDIAGNALSSDYSWTFTTASPPPPPPTEGPGGPILVISAAANPFSRYPVEILRAEGLNEFSAMDVSVVNETILNNHDVVILGAVNVNASQVTMLTNWVNAGGTLIALKPSALLSPLMGITSASGTLSDKYLLFNTTSGPGVGLVDQTIQFHGAADYYNLNTATALATLYSGASSATIYPAVTTNSVGANGGKAIAFTYDLAKSIVYTRQGNPAWAGQERDGQPENLRSSDMFFPDWIDFNKVAIPQADEQQRLLTNIILQSNLHRKPLPRFWFLPRKLKAAIVMTGDDHGSGGTNARFNQYLGYGNNTAADVLNWNAVRGTSYIYPNTPVSDAQAAAFNAQGFEIALHLSTNCGTYNQSSLEGFFNTQLPEFTSKYVSLPLPVTNRTHCISWSDWASKPKVELANGIRLNTDYYYWPAAWIQNRPGMFTGSGMPMRFADVDGTIIDNYQVTTQMPDESGISYSGFINTLLDNAIGAQGYYGVFCANMHTDAGTSEGSDAIIASAIARQIPVISAKQMLTWLDGRNGSSFGAITWSGNNLNFSISVASGSENLQGMVPVASASGQLTAITKNGAPVAYTTEIIKGMNYAFFNANAGNYTATYFIDNTAPIITNIIATPSSNGTAIVTWTTNENASSTIHYGTSATDLNQIVTDQTLATNHSMTLTGLILGTTYYFRVTSVDAASNSTIQPVSPATMSFTMAVLPANCFQDEVVADFAAGTTDSTFVSSGNDGEVTLKPTVSSNFSGSAIPSGWQSFAWTGGTSAVAGGVVTVNGARFNTVSPTTTFGPGSTVEFIATFGGAAFQHIGFGAGNDAAGSGGIYNGESAWAMFSTGNTTSQLQARTFLGTAGPTNINIGSPGAYTGTAHLYRIEWKQASIDFYIDDTLVNTTTTTIGGTMRPAISDYNIAAPGISVDWIKVSPYAAAGIFTSRIYDAGSLKTWGNISWTEGLPAGTTIQLSQRQSNSADNILTAPWNVASNGGNIGGTSRFIQYKAALSTSNTAMTPVLKAVNIMCSAPVSTMPVVITDPISVTKCSVENVSFTSAASGNPMPMAQWQLSVDNGENWSDIPSATGSSYTFIASASDNGKRFRAVWTNAAGSVLSNPAALIVNALPTATIGALTNPVCAGGSASLQLLNATGTAPYSLVVNGITYPNISVGQTFATINTTELSIWGNTGSPANPSVTDNQPIEVGTKFRSTVSGYITGIRFYKGLTNTGTHTANLWTTTGSLLASAIFTAETASGWQEVRFATPVAIQANTTYIASYLSSGGYFAITSGFFAGTGVTNGPLTALQSGTDGVNGVYKYGGGFPNGGNTANYWVDVLFSQINTSGVYNLTSITDGNGCTNQGSSLSAVTIATSALPHGTLTAASPNVCEGSNMNLIFNAAVDNGPYSLMINGTAFNNISSGIPFSAAVATVSPVNSTIWPLSTIGGSQTVDNAASELGVKIKSSIPGTISGIRFYKPGTDVLNFTGSLWAEGNTAMPLATANYTSDSTPGWKEITFATPIAVAANTSYIASYFSPGPNYYAYTANGLSTAIVNAPLTAETSLYKQPGAGCPNSNSTANYWIDVIFNSTSSISNFNLTAITSAAGCSTTGNPLSSAVIAVNSSPTPTFSGSVGTMICMNSDVTYTTQIGQTNYLWTISGTPNTDYIITSGGVGSTNHTVTLKWLTAGQKTVTANYSNAIGCTSDNAATSVTTVKAGPRLENISQTAIVCHGEAANITITASGGTSPGILSYTFDGVTNATGTFTHTAGTGLVYSVSDSSNCNILTGTVDIIEPNALTNTTTQTACDSYRWTVTGMDYASTGTYTGNSINGDGCSVNEILVLTINNSTSSTETVTACDSYTWSANNVNYTASGIYTNTTINAAGCNDVVTLNLTINHSTTSTISVTAYDRYTWAENNTTYITSGTYISSTVNAAGCSHVATLILTIIKSANSVMSGSATICRGSSANIIVTITGGAPPYAVVYTDGSSNFTVNGYQSGVEISVLPTASTTYTLVSVTDSNAMVGSLNTGNAVILVNQLYPFYNDTDLDGYGVGNQLSVCAVNANTPPSGYSINNVDCNDTLFGVNPGHAEVLYNGIDDNCNSQLDEGFQIKTKLLPSICGATLASIGSLIGITTVSSAITAYRIRVTNGNSVQIIERNVPHFSLLNLPSFDYATTYSVDIELQRYGIWLGYYGIPCLITSPTILSDTGAAQVIPAQCGTILPRINTLISTVSLPAVTGYRFRVTNITEGAIGPNVVQTIDRQLHWFSLQMLTQYNYNATYRVEVAVKTNGVYSGFGYPCEVTSPAAPLLLNCGGTVPTAGTLVAATSLSGVTQYRFQLTRLSNGATTSIDRGTNYFSFNMIPGYAPGVQYSVRIAVLTVGTWSTFGDICIITSPGTAARLMAETVKSTADDFSAIAYPNPFNTEFSIMVTTSSTETVTIKSYDMLGRIIESTTAPVSEIPSIRLGSSYPSGIYNLVVGQEGEIKTIRIIKR